MTWTGLHPLSAKAVTALLREARSLSRRADKLGGAAAAMDDPETHQHAAEACTSVEQLVHHLMVLERQLPVIGSQKLGRGGSPERSAQSRLNTPLSPATTMAASSQPANVNQNDAHAAQPSATKLSRCLKFTTGNNRSIV
jgi:hypothetical protein